MPLKLKNLIPAILMGGMVSACTGMFHDPYVYAPQKSGEKPATLSHSAYLNKDGSKVDGHQADSVIFAVLTRIDDKYVADGLAEVKKDPKDLWTLSPGVHDLVVEAVIAFRGKDIHFKINALPGEHYTIGVYGSPLPNESAGEKEYMVWIQNSAGKRIVSSKLKLVHGQSMTFYSIPRH